MQSDWPTESFRGGHTLRLATHQSPLRLLVTRLSLMWPEGISVGLVHVWSTMMGLAVAVADTARTAKPNQRMPHSPQRPALDPSAT